ncbi:Hypothetical protein CCH01_008740 [Clostridium chauvoei JF4335]|nr:Hypothetical protein CCH01_008740 [Clostridium chauvoei JF4335]
MHIRVSIKSNITGKIDIKALVYIFSVEIIILETVVVFKNIFETPKVIKKLSTPWINFQKIYFFIGGLYLLTTELTCAITDKLEKEQIKLIILSFKLIDKVDVEINLHPFVNSMLPKKSPYKESVGNLSKSSKLCKTMLI